MAIQKITTSSSKMSSIESSLNTGRSTIATRPTSSEIGHPTERNFDSIKKIIDEPIVNLINSAKSKNNFFLKCSVDTDAVIFELLEGAKSFLNKDFLNCMNELNERIRGVEIKDSFNAELAIRGFKSFLDSFIRNMGGIEAVINPDGTVSVTYLGEKSVANKEIEPNFSFSNLSSFSYKLHRKAQTETTWALIKSGDSYGRIHIIDTKPLKLGEQYTYQLSIKNKKNNKEVLHETTLLYEALKIKIVNFEAYPDPIKKNVYFICKIENAINSSIKIERQDSGAKFKQDEIDENVYFGKKYKYILSASNVWQKEIKVEAIADCTNTKPFVGKISYKMRDFERGVIISWSSIHNGAASAVKRQNPKTKKWDTICPRNREACSQKTCSYNTSKTGTCSCSSKYLDGTCYTDTDDSAYPDAKTLTIGETYNYQVIYSNEWGDSYSDIISVKMINNNNKPHMPSILPPGDCTLKWIATKNVKKYFIQRIDKPNEIQSLKDGSENCYTDTDTSKEPGKIYTYTIVARNGWCESTPCYFDEYYEAQPNEQLKGINDDNRYKYIGQNKNDKKGTLNFQGITTDGEWWYTTNGTPKWWPSLRRAGVDETLNRPISCDYDFPDKAHVGDLDCYGDYLFVAVYKESEGDRAEIWIFNKNTMHRITTCALYKKIDYTNPLKPVYTDPLYSTGWCAVNPCDKRLYTSQSNIMDGKIYSFKIDFDNIRKTEKGKEGLQIFSDPVEVMLFDDGKAIIDGILQEKENKDTPFIKESMQGGCFDYYNNLYLNSGYYNEDDKRIKTNEGIQVFKLIRDEKSEIEKNLKNISDVSEKSKAYKAYKSGYNNLPCVCTKAILIARSNKTNGFKYQFDVKKGAGEEPEGLVYFDFYNAPDNPPQNYVGEGSFHATLLLNSDNACEETMCFKHYEHPYRETEIRHTSYGSGILTLSVENSYNEDGSFTTDWKVDDHGILLKKFNTEDDARRGMEVLKNFNLIRTFGWLYTSSPDHNYEFSVLTWKGKESLSPKANFVIEYDASNLTYLYYHERHIIYFVAKNKRTYHFCAHNKDDADHIYETLSGYKKICIIGKEPDDDNKFFFKSLFPLEKLEYGYRIRSEYNLIWLE